MKKIVIAALLLTTGRAIAQQDSSIKTEEPSPLSFSAYVEAYYSYDGNTPADHNKAPFFYSHNRHNEFNVNLAFVKAAYSSKNIRGNLAIGAGTYMTANYAAEPGTLKNIYEANAGIKLSRKKNLWLDAGIFSSHIGFESAVSKDCWAVTRTMAAESSPYFEAGAKLTYTSDNKKWLLSALALNGWQRITRVDGNSLMSFGTQVQYIPSKNLLLNYSTFIGTDQPDSSRRMRYYHNFYSTISIGKFGILPSFDIGMEQKAKGSNAMNLWFAPVLRLRYTLNEQWKIALRGEYYADRHGVIINTGTPNGFKTSSYSFNVDYAPVPAALLRMEIRTFKSRDDVFIKNNTPKDTDHFLTASLAISF